MNLVSLCPYSNRLPQSTSELHFPASFTPAGCKRGATTLLDLSSILYAGGGGFTPPSHPSTTQRRKQHAKKRKMRLKCYRKYDDEGKVSSGCIYFLIG